MKRLGVFLLPPGWDVSPSQSYPSIKFPGTLLYTWAERATVRFKCLANSTSPARVQTRTTRSGEERINHKATLKCSILWCITFIMSGLWKSSFATHSSLGRRRNSLPISLFHLQFFLKKKISFILHPNLNNKLDDNNSQNNISLCKIRCKLMTMMGLQLPIFSKKRMPGLPATDV